MITREGLAAFPARVREVRGWRAHALLLVLFALLATPLVAHEAVQNRELSIFDEWQYAERVHQVATGDPWMANGEVIGPWAQGTRACRGIVRVVGPQPDPCWGKEPVYIANSAAADPPPYFWVTGALTGIALKTGLTDNAVTTGRLVGIGWAALSMWALFLLSRALGAGRAGALVVASTVLLVPAFLQQYTFITPHALDIPVGAFAALATLRFLRREWPWWTLVLAGLAVAGVKGSNVVIVVGLGVALLAAIVWPNASVDRASRIRALVAGVALSVSTVLFTVLWQVVVNATEVLEPPPPGNFMVERLEPQVLAMDSIRFLSSFGEGTLGVASVWLLIAINGSALAVWAGLAREQRPFVRQLAPGYLLGCALGALVLDLMVFVTTDQYIGIHIRYGLALFPLGLAFLALLLRTRTSQVVALAALLLYAATPAILGLDSIAM